MRRDLRGEQAHWENAFTRLLAGNVFAFAGTFSLDNVDGFGGRVVRSHQVNVQYCCQFSSVAPLMTW